MNKNLPLNRERALFLLKEYNEDKADMNHYLESEAIMRGIARYLKEDEEYWGTLGLLHDIDWGITKDSPEEHLTKAGEILRTVGFDEDFVSVIISHGYGFDCAGLKEKKRARRIEHALAAAETISGLVHAYSLMKPISQIDASGLKRKFNDKKFAAGANRDIIKEIEKCGIPLNEFFNIAIDAVRGIVRDIGLR
jgi:putative nucleotidyltransferase with HDIG domain